MFCALRLLKIRGVRSGFIDHLSQHTRVLQHRARAKHVLVERLMGPVLHEQRRLQAFQNRLLMDVRIRVVNEDTRLCISIGIDVEIVSSAGNAASDKLAVILEIHRVDHLAALVGTDLTDSVINVFTLLRARHQVRRCLHANRHQVEVPAETDALLNLHIQEFVRRDRLKILCCVADGCSEEAAVCLQNVHRLHDACKDTIAAAKVIDLREAFQRDGEAQVSDLADLLRKFVIDQGSIRVRMEFAVMVLFAKLQDVCLADERLAAREHVEVYAKLLALRDNAVQVLKAQIQLVTILRSPAASAVQVAG